MVTKIERSAFLLPASALAKVAGGYLYPAFCRAVGTEEYAP